MYKCGWMMTAGLLLFAGCTLQRRTSARRTSADSGSAEICHGNHTGTQAGGNQPI